MAKRVELPLLNADSHCASCVPAGVWGRVGEVVVRWRRERKWRPNFISKRAKIKDNGNYESKIVGSFSYLN